MAVLSPPQVYALARRVGGSPAWSLAMVGVVATESGGVTDQVQPNGKGRGLVQIDLGQHPDVTEAQAFDPEWSMRWALAHTKGDPSKANAPLFYGPRDHPDTAQAARRQALESNPEAVGGDNRSGWEQVADGIGHILALDPLAAIRNEPGGPGSAIADVGSFVVSVGKAGMWVGNPHNWLRVLEVLVGAALILAGMWRLSPGTAAGIKSVAKKATAAVALA